MELNEQQEVAAAEGAMPAEAVEPMPADQQPAQAPPEGDSQDAYDAVMAVVDTLLYKDEKVSDAIMQSISQPPFPRAVGQAAAQVIKMIDERFDDQLPDDIIVPATCDTAEKIAQMGEAAGLFKIEGQFVEQTIGFATAAAGELYGVGPEELQQQAQEAEGQMPAEAAPMPEGQAPAPAGLMEAANVQG